MGCCWCQESERQPLLRGSTSNVSPEELERMRRAEEELQAERQAAAKKREDMERKRAAIIEELIATERTYVSKLDKLVDEFYNPLLDKAKARGLSSVTEEDIHGLFKGITPIRMFNRQLLDMLVAGKEGVGKIFGFVANFLKVYTEYIRTYDQRNDLLQSWLKKKKNFRTFVKSRSEPLASLMITPIQRIPRYVLLLKSLIESTPSDNADFENLKNALVLVESCCSHINEIKRFSDSGGLILELQGWIEGDFDNLIAPHRKLLKSASVKAHEVDDSKELPSILENPPKLSDRKIYLFNDLFLWTSSKNKFKGAFALAGANSDLGSAFFKESAGSEDALSPPASERSTSPSKKSRFSSSFIGKLRPSSTPIRLESLVVLSSKEGTKNLIFQLSTDEDAKSWLSALEENIDVSSSALAPSSPKGAVSDSDDGAEKEDS